MAARDAVAVCELVIKIHSSIFSIVRVVDRLVGGHLDYIPIVLSSWAGPCARVPAGGSCVYPSRL